MIECEICYDQFEKNDNEYKFLKLSECNHTFCRECF